MKKKEFEAYLREIEEIDNVKDAFFGIFTTTTHINTESYNEFTKEQLIDSLAILYAKYAELNYLTQEEMEQLPQRVWGESDEEQQWLGELFNEVVEFVRDEKYGPSIEL